MDFKHSAIESYLYLRLHAGNPATLQKDWGHKETASQPCTCFQRVCGMCGTGAAGSVMGSVLAVLRQAPLGRYTLGTGASMAFCFGCYGCEDVAKTLTPHECHWLAFTIQGCMHQQPCWHQRRQQ